MIPIKLNPNIASNPKGAAMNAPVQASTSEPGHHVSNTEQCSCP
jgi:hypothetical protein